MSNLTDRASTIARRRFGFETLHPGQEAAIEAIVSGRDTLAVMPTGSGKSAIYQIASLLRKGPTIVVSPLIALQHDQVESIQRHHLGDAAEVNSMVAAGERDEAMEEFEEDELEFLFVAPEQFHNQETLDRIKEAGPGLFVVDEAHCISEWGHDFRPEYLRLGAVVEALGHPPVLALTATAAPPVRQEIMERLHMRDPLVVVRGFNRPNIWLGVEKFHDERTKTRALLERVTETEKPGIVYVSTRKHAEEIVSELTERGVKAVAYHAGMKTHDRQAAQEAFMTDEAEVMVATTAFGMGIDKPNVRFVFHYEISDSVDTYYQEIGRGGRDGAPAKAILFYRAEDLGIHRFFAGGGKVTVEQVEQVAEVVEDHEASIEIEEIHEETGLTLTKVNAALTRLEEVGVVEALPTGEVEEGQGETGRHEAAEAAVLAQEHHRAFERSRIEMMRGYAEVWDCRREYLLNYFGEAFHDPCDYCDNCNAGVTVAEDEGNEPFPLNSRVRHGVWGEGLVQRYEGDTMIVLFDDVGYKTLDTGFVTDSGALQAAS